MSLDFGFKTVSELLLFLFFINLKLMGFEWERVSCNNNNNRTLVFFETNPDSKKELFPVFFFFWGGVQGMVGDIEL